MVLLALAGEAVANAVVEACSGLVVDGCAQEEILVLLGGVVGDMIEIPGVGHAGGGDAVVEPWHESAWCRSGPAEIGCASGYVEFVVRQVVGSLQPTAGAKVVELFVRAGNFKLFARSVEVAGASPWKSREGKLVVPCGVVRLTTLVSAPAPKRFESGPR